MAVKARRVPAALLFQLIGVVNAFGRQATSDSAFPHTSVTSRMSGAYPNEVPAERIVTAATATTLLLVIASANDSLAVFDEHVADSPSTDRPTDGAHLALDGTNTIGLTPLTVAATQGATNTRLNAMKAKMNAHCTQSGVHFTNDTTNTISAADATNLASSETLADAIKAFVNAHVRFAYLAAGQSFLTVVDA